MAEAPHVRRKNRPHILLITTDQQRFDALGVNNPESPLETPNLDALAARGVNFENCYVTCPVCIPARRTLLSGLHPASHGLKHYQDGLDWDPPFTLPGLLSDEGYQTQLVGKLHMHPIGKRYGFDHMVLSETSNWRPTSEFQPRNDYARWLRRQGVADHPHFHGINGNGRLVYPWQLEERFHQNNWLAQEAVQFLTEDRDPTAPFFLHLSFFHPHPPLVPPAPYLDRYLRKEMPGATIGNWAPQSPPRPGTPPDSATGPFDDEIIRRAQAGYFALINHIDDCIAFVLERWQEYGNKRGGEPLYIIFSSDHGEMLGDHHLFRKSLGYEASAHVPFFISGRNVDLEPATVPNLTCWEDVLPTIADLAGAELPSHVDGISQAPLLTGGQPRERDHIYGVCHGSHSNHFLVAGDYKYLWFPKTNEEQLFDLEADPRETHDLSGEENLLRPFRKQMAAALQVAGEDGYDETNLQPCRNQPPTVFWPAGE